MNHIVSCDENESALRASAWGGGQGGGCLSRDGPLSEDEKGPRMRRYRTSAFRSSQ